MPLRLHQQPQRNNYNNSVQGLWTCAKRAAALVRLRAHKGKEGPACAENIYEDFSSLELQYSSLYLAMIIIIELGRIVYEYLSN